MEADGQLAEWFWQLFESYTQEQRKLYLKFVWGRNKLPKDTSSLRDKHHIECYPHWDAESLPRAHTCFFVVDIPKYKTYEMMQKRITLAIETCGEIDADGDAQEEDASHSNYSEE